MLCPKCNKKMKIMATLDRQKLINGDIFEEVIGCCRDCDFDATWETVIDMDGHIEEFNFKQYFFG